MASLHRAITALFFLSIAVSVHGHPGRTDAQGGHYNRSTGEYHFHNGGAARPAPQPAEVSPTPRIIYREPAALTSRLDQLRRQATKPPQIPWHDIEGQVLLTGSYLGVNGDPAHVWIRKADNTQSSIAFDKLSIADRAFVLAKGNKNSEFRKSNRQWVSADGNYRVNAKAISGDNKAVILARAGKTTRVPLDKLSNDDQSYLLRLQQAIAKPLELDPEDPFAELEDGPFSTVEAFAGSPRARDVAASEDEDELDFAANINPYNRGPSQTATPTYTPTRPAPQWNDIPRDSPAKTVHVRGYYRKDGTYVRPHWRRPPSR